MRKGQHLDAISDVAVGKPSNLTGPGSARRFLGVHFACCDVYVRVYTNREQTAYVGHCPRCAKRVELRIGTRGTDARFSKAH